MASRNDFSASLEAESEEVLRLLYRINYRPFLHKMVLYQQMVFSQLKLYFELD